MTRVQLCCQIADSVDTAVHIHSRLATCIGTMDAVISQKKVKVDDEFRAVLKSGLENVFVNIDEDGKQNLINILVASKMTDSELFQYVKVLESSVHASIMDICNRHIDAIGVTTMAYFNKFQEDILGHKPFDPSGGG